MSKRNGIRTSDLVNLEKIPVIEERILGIHQGIMEIKASIESFNQLKVEVAETKINVNWLKNWHNKIVLGILISLISAAVLGFFQISANHSSGVRNYSGNNRAG